MNKTELLKIVSDHADHPAAAPGAVSGVQHALYTISAALFRGERVELKGFGTFSVVVISSRVGRHPRTGEPVQIAARRRIKFKPSKMLLG